MKRLTDKVTIVTGAASAAGIGFATGRLFAREGAKVVLTDLDADAVETRASTLRGMGLPVVACAHDVTTEESWREVLEKTLLEFGRLDVLVNNAGIVYPGNIGNTPLQAWNHHIAVNLTGVFLGCQTAVRQMRAQKSPGSIINTSSSSAVNCHPNLSAYIASKGGVLTLTRTAALDVAAEGIRINAVLPGLMLTEMNTRSFNADPGLVSRLQANIPLGHLGEADDIANMNLYLASDDSKFITGAQFCVNGGTSAR